MNSDSNFDLTKAHGVIISIPGQRKRFKAMNRLMEKLGMSFEFSDGCDSENKRKGCLIAHRDALNKIKTFPTILMEDDLKCFPDDAQLPTPPADADIVYLFTHRDGAGEFNKIYQQNLGTRSFDGGTLAQDYNAHYARLYAMIGGLSIMFMTQKGLDAFKHALHRKNIGMRRSDVAYSHALKNVKAYCVKKPFLTEDMELQGKRKGNAEREALLYSDLKLRKLGDEVEFNTKQGSTVTMRVEEFENGAWVWNAISAVPTEPIKDV